MLDQGPSKNATLMEWDKLWANNKKIIEPITPRLTAISKEKTCKLLVKNGPELCSISVPVHPKNAELGQRPVFKSKNIILEFDDAKDIAEGDKITLMKWGNVVIHSKKAEGDHFVFEGEYLPEDKDFKSTKKVNWLSSDAQLAEVVLVELDHIITVEKYEEDK